MKTTFKYDHYYLYDEVVSNIKALADAHPGIMSYESICVTKEGRDVLAVTLTNKATGSALSKPAFHIDGNTHAGEVTGSMAAMHTMDYLVTNYGVEEDVTKLLDECTIYIVPRVSPDGAETYLTTPYTLRSVNREYLPKEGGMKQEDMDGDNVIRTIRVKTPYGAWKKDPNNANLMIRRSPDEKVGEFYNVFSEGMIENFDGININPKKPTWGLDFNRNYPFGWFSEVRQPGAGAYPLSNPENKAMVDWVLNHNNISGVLTHHTSGGVILYPPGTKPEAKAFGKDMEIFKAIGKMGTQEMGYPCVNIFDSFMIDQENYSSGAFDDWCYQDQGIYAYTVELWDLNTKLGMPTNWTKNDWTTQHDEMKKYEAVINWTKENNPDAFLPWTKFNHPQLGEVEIGGFNYKFVFQNPPKQLLLEEVEKTTKFSLRFAKSLPQLIVDNVTSEKVAEGVYKVEALVSNNGYMPTNVSSEAKALKVDKPVMVCLEGATEFVSGTSAMCIGDLAGFAQIETGAEFYGNFMTMYNPEITKKVTWIIKAEAGTAIKVTAAQNKSGTATKEITL